MPVYYLGKADDLLARLQGKEALRIKSASHGTVAAMWAQAKSLGIAKIIDDELAENGRRIRPQKKATHEEVGATQNSASPPQPVEKGNSTAGDRRTKGPPPVKNDGLTVGQSLELACLGRACHATSKRGFASWASTTTLGSLAEVDVERLTSQHFWDQMDQLPIQSIDRIEREIVNRVLENFDLPVDTLLFDATNFFTFIASTNEHCELPARGHNKQKRDDLRQVGVALLCSRIGGIPLWHQTYGGEIADSKSFADSLPAMRRRLVELHRDVASLTIVFDKGNVSKAVVSPVVWKKEMAHSSGRQQPAAWKAATGGMRHGEDYQEGAGQ